MRTLLLASMAILITACSSGDDDGPDVVDGVDLQVIPSNEPINDAQGRQSVHPGDAVNCSLGEEVILRFAVLNAGNESVGAGVRMSLVSPATNRLLENDEPIAAKTRSHTGIVVEVTEAMLGNHSFTITVDPENTIAEAVETNNSMSFDVLFIQVENG